MPTSKTKLKNAAIAAKSAALPKIAKECVGRPNIDHGFRGSNDQGRRAALGAAVCG